MLDTVFVVGIHDSLRLGSMVPNWVSDLYREITIDLIETQIPGCGLRLYGGETWSSKKPFSFVPCRPAEPEPSWIFKTRDQAHRPAAFLD